MTYFLQKALKEFLLATFAGSWAPSPPSGDMVTPRIIIGALPPKRSTAEQGEDFPFFIVRATDGEDPAEEKPEVGIDIIIGAWVPPDSAAEEGVIEIHKMNDKARLALRNVGEGSGLLENKYELQYPIKWKAGVRDSDGSEAGGQPHPYYYITINTRWLLPPVTKPLSVTEEVQDHGAGFEE